jgi:hypothetical protein
MWFFGLLFGLLAVAWWWRKRRRFAAADELERDVVLYHWDKANAFTLKHLLDGGLCVTGRTGSGKTSSLLLLAKALLLRHVASFLILCAKPGESSEWIELLKQTGRSDDLLHFHAGGSLRLNMLDHEAKRSGPGAGQAQNLTRFIMDMRTAVFREAESTGGDSQQWIKQDERGIRNAIVLLLHAKIPVTPVAIQRVLLTAPQTAAEIQTPAWKEGYCNEVLSRAYAEPKSAVERHDYDQAATYLLQEWCSMGDRTRGSILTGIQSILGLMSSGLCHDLFFDRTNVSPEACLSEPKIVLIDVVPDEYGDLGLLANIGFKQIWQKAILRRRVETNTPPCIIWGDESSLWYSKSDVEFLSRCRQSRGAMVYLSQSLHAYKALLPGEKSDAMVNALLANFGHKLFFALGDYETAEWAADLCGKELQTFRGGSVQLGNPQPLELFGSETQSSGSFHEQYEYIVRPEAFMNNLRTGGMENQRRVDAILTRSGVPFSNGYNVLPVTFTQEAPSCVKNKKKAV